MLIFLDTETTGFDPQDRILQLSYITDTGFVYNDLCKPPVDCSFGAMAIHYVTSEMLTDKPKCTETDAFLSLANLYNIPDNVIVIHNSKFDLEMLEKEGFTCHMQVIDTLKIARVIYPDSERHSLQFLRYSLGLYKQETQTLSAHDALSDVIMLKNLFEHLEKKISIKEMVEITKNPILLKRLSFGKYKGQEYSEVDKSYLRWCLNNMENLTEDQEFTMRNWL